jgi:flagellar basal-body rod protein FlgB
MQIVTPFVQALGTALRMHTERHALLAENVANAETPGYRARDLDFGNVLAAAFDEQAQADGTPQTPAIDAEPTVVTERNPVDVDIEMARLSENALKIVALSQFLSRSYAGLKRAIGEVR